VPAHNCGVYGFRPTHGCIPLDGIVPFSPSFDTVGWFARDAGLLRRVGRVLLPAGGQPSPPTRLLVGDDLFALADGEVRAALAPLVPLVAAVVGPAEHLTVSPQGPGAWAEPFDTLRKAEVRATLGDWIERDRPQLGPGTRKRFLMCLTVTEEDVARTREARQHVRRHLDELLASGGVLCLPTAPLVAPPRDSSDAVLDVYRTRTLQLSCLAPAGGLPQVSLPLAVVEGCPVGLSLVAGRGQDALLWDLAVAVEGKVGSG
jgi:amidase